MGLEVRFEGRALATVAAIVTGAPAAIVAPGSIDNTGATDVSAALTNWLTLTGNPGDTFQLRRRAGDLPGLYWVPRGVKIGKAMSLDLNGCALFTGTTMGFDDPQVFTYDPLFLDHQAALALWPPLWNDWQEQTLQFAWPNRRSVVALNASNVRLFSSRTTAVIQGANRLVHYRGNLNLVGRAAPTGCQFYSRPEVHGQIGDGQHGIRIGAEPGNGAAKASANPIQNIEIDLTNIDVGYTHGDGIYLGDNNTNIWIHGQQLGEPVLGGVPHPVDDGVLLGHTLQGGDIDVEVGAESVPGDPRTGDRWTPWTTPMPGIHHVGRQGIATDFRCYQVLIEGFSIWRTARACIDWEPGASFAEIVGATVRDMEFGIHTLLMMPCGAWGGPINDMVLENVVTYETPTISRKPGGDADDVRPQRARSHNWRIQNVVCPTGVKMRVPDVFVLPGIDGLQVLDCNVPVKGTAKGLVTDVGFLPPAHASTGVVIDPPLVIQFPFQP